MTRIYGVEVRFGTATFEVDPPSEDEMRRRYDAQIAGGFPYLVAEDASGQVVGFAAGGPHRPRHGYRFTVEDSVYVAAAARGTGVGSALLGALVTECEQRGFRKMIGVIGDAANVGSIRLHERAGFTRAGVLKGAGWKLGRWLDVVLVERPLGDGTSTPAR